MYTFYVMYVCRTCTSYVRTSYVVCVGVNECQVTSVESAGQTQSLYLRNRVAVASLSGSGGCTAPL